MLVLIDESGDPGFKLARGSSSHFVVCMIVFGSFDEAEKCSSAIQSLQSELRIYPEFKFSNCRADIRDKFFMCIQKFNFSVYALVVPKQDLYSLTLRTDTDKFYNYFVRQLLSNHKEVLSNASIKIDESGDKKFKRELLRYLKNQMASKYIRKMRFASSRNDHLIQLADMVTGAVARVYTQKKDNAKWHGMIAHKIANLWKFS